MPIVNTKEGFSEIIDLRASINLMDTALICGCPPDNYLIHIFFCGELLQANVSARKALAYSLGHSASLLSCGCAATWRTVRNIMGAEYLVLHWQMRKLHAWSWGEGGPCTNAFMYNNEQRTTHGWGSSTIIFKVTSSINNALNQDSNQQ